MTDDGPREEMEEDLAWRLDEIRTLRNLLLGGIRRSEDWPVSSVRALLVMQYAHLEGFTQNCLAVYVESINASGLPLDELKQEIAAAGLASQFKRLRSPLSEEASETSRLLSRAKRHVDFVRELVVRSGSALRMDPDEAVSLEMNLGEDVLKKNFYILGLPENLVDKAAYSTLEFIRKNRNDIAHGSRRAVIPVGLFEAHSTKAEQFMNDLIRALWHAMSEQWFRRGFNVP